MSKKEKKQPNAKDSYKGASDGKPVIILKDMKTGKETKVNI